MLWTIKVIPIGPHGMIITKRGYKDGKMQYSETTVTEGKNIGKKNQTTPYQQAISEAKTAWMKNWTIW